ncbi:sugar kinase [Chelonobacter oris]|uniref:Sugar kinase n=1 Tax=Chelonobacter oris TaxID=505317 RepID=A0A0A3AQ10_9PAST|nr:PfkB family carbohydrate kinase [Chelonobacter oris]KGQ71446.1 sugar kinase [Chelonobacter oris]
MVKVACLGIAVQDRIYYLDKMPQAGGGKFVAHHYKEVGGGPAATAAVAIAKLGVEVDFIGRLGDDDIGSAIISELSRYRVNPSKIKVYREAKSSQSSIFVDNSGERVIVNYPSPDLSEHPDWLEEIDFRQYDVVLCDVRWHLGAEYCLQKAKKLGIPTVLDADITPQNIEPLVKLADHVIFSAPGLEKMTNEKDLNKALMLAKKICGGTVYVTKGSEGCDWIVSDIPSSYKGFEVNVVDTTGAGDVFHGAFAYAIANKYAIKRAVVFANAVAALKCTAEGGRDGIPSLQEVENFMLYANG